MYGNCWCRQSFWESYSKAANDAAQSLAVRRNKEAGVRDLFRKAVARLIPLQVIPPPPSSSPFIQPFILCSGRLYKACPTSGPCPRCFPHHSYIPALPPSSICPSTHSFTHSLAHTLTRSLAHSLAHPLAHSLTHSLTHSLLLMPADSKPML